MSRFKTFLESSNEIEWQRLYEYCLGWYKGGMFKPTIFQTFHENLIRMLKNVGMNNEANELEMYKPSQTDLEFGSTTHNIGAKMSDVLRNKLSYDQQQSFEAAYRSYSQSIEHIMDLIEQKANLMKWQIESWGKNEI